MADHVIKNNQSHDIISPLDYSRCKNSEQHGPLLHDIISKVNDMFPTIKSADRISRETDTKFEVFKAEVDGKFKVVGEKIDNIKTDLENTKTAVSGVATTGDLSEQNKVLLNGIMEIVKGKGENKKAWIGVVGMVAVAIISLISTIYNTNVSTNSEKKFQELLNKIEVQKGETNAENR